jgi:hypothetical protein
MVERGVRGAKIPRNRITAQRTAARLRFARLARNILGNERADVVLEGFDDSWDMFLYVLDEMTCNGVVVDDVLHRSQPSN